MSTYADYKTQIQFVLPWPPTVNHYYGQARNGRRFIKPRGLKFREDVLSAVKRWLPHCKAYFHKGRVGVLITVCSPDRRRRDINNLGKALFDALGKAGVYKDDSQIDLELWRRDPDNIVKGGSLVVSIMSIKWEPEEKV